LLHLSDVITRWQQAVVGTQKMEISMRQQDATERALNLTHGQISAKITRMWANAQPDGRPAKHRWRPLFNAAKFG